MTSLAKKLVFCSIHIEMANSILLLMRGISSLTLFRLIINLTKVFAHKKILFKALQRGRGRGGLRKNATLCYIRWMGGGGSKTALRNCQLLFKSEALHYCLLKQSVKRLLSNEIWKCKEGWSVTDNRS